MKPQKITVEYYSESDVCESEIMTITANSVLMDLDEYYITITSDTGISFNDKSELKQKGGPDAVRLRMREACRKI